MNKAIVLAAGEGTRMNSDIPKVMHKVLGVSMIKSVVEELQTCDLDEIIIIVSKNKRDIMEELSEYDNVVLRDQPLGEAYPYGTGFAVMQATDRINDEDQVLVVNGDTPLLRGETLKGLLEFNGENGADATILTAVVEDNHGYGRILKDAEGHVREIIEEADANEAEKKIKEINSGVYVFEGKSLKENLQKLDTDNVQGELYLTDMIRIMAEEESKITSLQVKDETEIKGVNSRIQLAQSENLLRDRINTYWMNEGITIINPDNTYIEKAVTIGKDSIIGPGVRLCGNTTVGSNCEITGDTMIVDTTIAKDTSVQSSYIEESVIGSDVTVGPYAHIRPGCDIGNDINIGNFAELKNTKLNDGVRMGHHSYLGDTTVGVDVNIGAGVITVNYDGVNKHKTIIGDHAFIGSNSNLIAPVQVSDRGYVAAGSTITKDVGTKELAVARSRQTIIKDWVKE